jgi:hypothetical protein
LLLILLLLQIASHPEVCGVNCTFSGEADGFLCIRLQEEETTGRSRRRANCGAQSLSLGPALPPLVFHTTQALAPKRSRPREDTILARDLRRPPTSPAAHGDRRRAETVGGDERRSSVAV